MGFLVKNLVSHFSHLKKTKNISHRTSNLREECKINVKLVWKSGKMVRIFATSIRKTSSIEIDIGTYISLKLFKNKFAILEISFTFAIRFRKGFESESKFDLLK